MDYGKLNQDHFDKIKALRLRKISLWLAAFLSVPLIQFTVQGDPIAISIIFSAQLVLCFFSYLLSREQIYRLSSFVIFILLGNVVFFRSLQGGGIESTSTVWFFSVMAAGLVFLQKKTNHSSSQYYCAYVSFPIGCFHGDCDESLHHFRRPTF